jgi:hypothetical protein
LGSHIKVGRVEFDQPTEPWGALDAIRKAVVVSSERPANSFTTGEYAARYNLPPKTADRQLREMVRVRGIQVRKCLVAGKISNVYWVK